MDPHVIAERVHSKRIQRGLSQEELAKRANISRATLQRIEAGYEVKPKTIRKLADCLRVIEWDFFAPIDVWNRPYRIYSGEDPQWLVAFNRKNTPGLYPDGTPVPNPHEKERLGRLGFVTGFVNRLNCDLHTGRLHASIAEIYGPDEKGPYRHLEEEFVYVLRGEVRIRMGDQEIDLREGQAMTFWPTEAHSYGLPRPLKRDEEPPLLLMVWTTPYKPQSLSPTGKRKRKPRAGKVPNPG